MTAQVTKAEPTVEELATAVDDAVAAMSTLDGRAREVADSVRDALEAVHRTALVTIVRRLRRDDGGRAALYELVDDPVVHLLFAHHGIIRPDPLTAANAALDAVRPGIRSHGGDVALDRIEDGVAYVRLSGACQGCSMSAVTMRETVEKALVDNVSAITSVQVLAAEPGPTVIPLSEVKPRDRSAAALAEAGWARALPVAELPDGKITPVRLGTDGVIVVRIGSSLTAYRDECAHQGLPLGDALLDAADGTLTCPWHGFRYDALSGECLTAVGATLEQCPLRVVDDVVWVRIEA